MDPFASYIYHICCLQQDGHELAVPWAKPTGKLHSCNCSDLCSCSTTHRCPVSDSGQVQRGVPKCNSTGMKKLLPYMMGTGYTLYKYHEIYIYIALHKHEVMFNAINRAKLGWPVMLMQHWYHKSGHTYMCEFCPLYIQHVYIMIGTHEHPVFKDIYTEFPLLIIVYYTKCHVDKASMLLTKASCIVYRTHDCISSVGVGLWHGHGVSTVGQEIPMQWLKETLYYWKISREKTFVDW